MELKESDKEQFYFDHYDPDELHNIIDTQHKVIEYMKKKGHKQLYSILVSRMTRNLAGTQHYFMHFI